MSGKIESPSWTTKKVKVKDLKAFEKNPRKITPKEMDSLKRSIAEDGYHQRILCTTDLRIIGGHQRIQAMLELGYAEVEVLVPDREISDEQFSRILVRDNMEYGTWNIDGLGELMPTAQLMEIGLGDNIINKIPQDIVAGNTDPDEVPDPPKEGRASYGDVWKLGDHTVMCGSCTNPADMDRLMNGEQAAMVFTDPPYNVDYGANSSNPRHKIRTIANDSMVPADWDKFVREYMTQLLQRCDGNIYIAMSDKELGHMQRVFAELGGRWASFIIWVKDSLVLSAKDYHSRHETILYGWREGIESRVRVLDRTQDDVWEIKRPKRSDDHPTMKPVELVERALANSSNHGDIVLDLFGGSGTTLLACERLGRAARLIEIEPKYVDVIIRRWEEYTGQKAVQV